MQSKHAQAGYTDIYKALVFSKQAQAPYGYPPAYYPQDKPSGFGRGLMSGLAGGGLAGIGSELYDMYGQRNKLMADLEAAAKSRSKIRPVPPNFIEPISAGKKNKFRVAFHPEAQSIYNLTPEEMEGLKSKSLKEFQGKMRKVITPSRMREAAGRMEGVGGFGRYALSRAERPLMHGLKWGVPAALIGATLGGVLG